MILLDPAVLTEQRLDVFAIRPTHALRRWLQISSVGADELQNIPPGPAVILGQDVVQAMYSYGTLSTSGAFLPMPHTPLVHVIVNMPHPAFIPPDVPPVPDVGSLYYDGLVAYRNQVIADEDLRKKNNAAAYNLRSAGVVPDPNHPWVPITVSSVRMTDDFKMRDLDAYVCNATVGDRRLRGTVI